MGFNSAFKGLKMAAMHQCRRFKVFNWTPLCRPRYLGRRNILTCQRLPCLLRLGNSFPASHSYIIQYFACVTHLRHLTWRIIRSHEYSSILIGNFIRSFDVVSVCFWNTSSVVGLKEVLLLTVATFCYCLFPSILKIIFGFTCRCFSIRCFNALIK
jgi:hypothetical protein